MTDSPFNYAPASHKPSSGVSEEQIEYGFIGTLQNLKYDYRADISDRASLERNFRDQFEALNRVTLSDGEFARLLLELVTPDVFTAARTLRAINAFSITRQIPKPRRRRGRALHRGLLRLKDCA